MGTGTERNAPCWCGSGRKFKHCHYGREAEAPITISEALAGSKHAHRPRECLHPNASKSACSGPPIGSHTIQRRGPLEKIAVDGHVLGFVPDFGQLRATGGRLEASKVGIKKASTFPGFCASHDRDTFAAIETVPIIPTSEQVFLIAYRALCKELFQKRAQSDVAAEVLRNADRGRPVHEQVAFQAWRSAHAEGTQLAMRDLVREKAKHDEILLNETWESEYQYLAVLLDDAPTIASTGAVIPECDFAGAALAELGRQDVDCDLLGFSILGTSSGGLILWACRRDSPHGMSFLKQAATMSDDHLVQAGARFAFEMIENTFCSPSWWSTLESSVMSSILRRVASGVGSDNPGSRRLVEDGVRLVDWRARCRMQKVT